MDDDSKAPLSAMEKMRVRLAAEGYQSFNNEDKAESCKASQKQESRMLCILLIISCLIVLGLCVLLTVQHWIYESKQACVSPDCVDISAKILHMMDAEADPCDDFYQYACGAFDQDPMIPPDKSKWGSFSKVSQHNNAIIRQMLRTEGSSYSGGNSTAIAKAKLFYDVCTNISETEKMGIAPMQKLITEVGLWPLTSADWSASTWQLVPALLSVHQRGSDPLFSVSIQQDDKNSSRNRIIFDQSGLTFSNYKNYVGNDTAKYRDAFVHYLRGVAVLLGADNSTATAQATDVMQFETRLAEVMDRPEQRQDARKMYHLMTVEQLQEFFLDSVDIRQFLNALFPDPVHSTEHVIVFAPNYIRKMAEIVKETPKKTLANYVVWHMVQAMVPYMPHDFELLTLQLKKVLTGSDTASPKWETCVARTSASLGFAVGALFIDEAFSANDKKVAEEILTLVRDTFEARLPKIDWMDEETILTAIDKAKAVYPQIGYPQYIKHAQQLDEHYEKLIISKSSFQNALNVLDFAVQKNLAKRNKAPDFNEWEMSPSTVNAYYTPVRNQIVFPAGIMMPPFYSPVSPMAINFGAIGMVMGHELTHGFDSSGRLFDKHGNLADWWGNSSTQHFTEKTKCLIKQYSDYQVGDGHLNGITTLGENIADNGGMKTSYYAYHSWLKDHGFQDNNVNLPGLNMTRDQLFFLGFAQVWCSYYTPEYARQSLVTDVHSYAKYRVIGVLSNMVEFSEAYQCSSGAKMNPETKCGIW